MAQRDKMIEMQPREVAKLRQRVAELEALCDEQRDNSVLRMLLEAASDGIIVVDRDGKIVLVNTRAAEMFGYSPAELLDQPLELLLPERLRSAHMTHRHNYNMQPRPRPMGKGYELVGRRRDGAEFPVEVSLSFVQSGDMMQIMAFVVDLTERKQADIQLQRTLEVLKKRNRDLAFLNQVGRTLTSTLNLQEVVDRLLKAVTETVGAEGSSVWLWHPEKQGWLVCQAEFQWGKKLPLVNRELEPGQGIAGWVAQNGKSLIVPNASADPRYANQIDAQTGFQTTSILTAPLRVRDETLGVLQIVNKRDGTFDAHDQALIETLAASAAIAIENAQLVEELRQHTEQLQARNEELDAFSHTVAHDIKNPLGIMAGFATVLEQQSGTISPDDLARYLRIIAQNGRKVSNIVDELLLLAGVRKAEAEMHALDTAAIVSETLGRLADLIESSGAEIVLPKGWPTAIGYAPWVEEVWVNYISNAIRYGGSPPRVELGANVQTGEDGEQVVRFWVQDNGPGLSEEEQTRLFTPFAQMHQARAQGHGLGLSIVRRIVRKLGGQVGVESQRGKGSRFFFTLDKAPDTP